MWQNLSFDIAQEFANPHWIELSIRDRKGGLFAFKPRARLKDGEFLDRALELLNTQYTWTARELSVAAGQNTDGAEQLCGQLLQDAGWVKVRKNDRKVWMNYAGVLEWFAARTYVSLRDAGQQIGLHPKILAPMLRENGWAETRRGVQRVWTRAAPGAAEVRHAGTSGSTACRDTSFEAEVRHAVG